MDLNWSLDELYTSFESQNLKKDIQKCFTLIDDMVNWAEINLKNTDKPVIKIEEYIKKTLAINDLLEKLYNYGDLTKSVDVKNQKAAQLVEKINLKVTDLTEPGVSFQKWLSTIKNFDQLVESSNLIKEHEFYLKEMLKSSKYMLSEKEEVLISKMQNTGSGAWARLYNLLISTLKVDINIDGEDKQLPLSVIRNMATDKDDDIRKKAYFAELNGCKKIEDSVAACLNNIKGEAITLTKMKGYSSPLERALINSRMDKETLDAMYTAIREYLPIFHKYFRKKGEMLGYKNGLPFYCLYAPIGNTATEYTYDDVRKYIVKCFSTFSDKLASFADKAFEKKWIDAEPKDGKAGGAFCASLHCLNESRILANLSGSFGDVTTIAHELGHGYHNLCLANETNLNIGCTAPIAETASIFCETIVKNAAIKDAKGEEALMLLEKSVSDSSMVVVDIYSRFLFESAVFEKRIEGSLSADELCELMLNAQKEAYGDGLDPNLLHKYMWICKAHYYDFGYYNFPYTFGLLFSFGLYAKYQEMGNKFVEEYDKLLSVTGRLNVADTAKIMGIDVHSVDFWKSSLNIIKNDIEKFLAL